MRRLVCLVGCLLVGVTVHAAEVRAAPVALLDAPRALDVAVAGGEVLVASGTPRNGVRLRAVPMAGGPARPLLAVPPPGRGWFVGDARLSSSAELTALLVAFIDPDGGFRHWQVYSGPPAGPLQLVHRVRLPRSRKVWAPIDLDVHGERLLIQELRQPIPSFRFMVIAPDGPPARVPQGRLGLPAAIAGDDLAYVGIGGRADAPAALRIVDWRTGRARSSLPLEGYSEEVEDRHLDMADGGRVVAALDGKLVAAAPGEPVHRLPGSSGASRLSAPRFAGDLVAALAAARLGSERPVLIDPANRTRRTVGPRSAELDALAAGAGAVTWLANGCVMVAGLDGGGPLDAPPPGPCPRAEVVLGQGSERLRGRRLRVSVACVAAPASGCRGEVLLGRGGGWAGRGRFRVPAGARRPVQVMLSRRGMAQVRRHHRRFGHAFLHLTARVRDGRVAREAGTGSVLIERLG